MSDSKAKDFSQKGMGSTDSLILQLMTGLWTLGIVIVLFTAVLPAFQGDMAGKEIAGAAILPASALATHMERTDDVSSAKLPVELAPKPTDPTDINELMNRAINHCNAGDRFAKEMAFEQAEAYYLSAYSLLNKVKSTSPNKVGYLLDQVLYKRGILYVGEGLYEAANATLKELEENYLSRDPDLKGATAEELGKLYQALGIVYKHLGETKMANTYVQKAEQQFSLIPKGTRISLD